MKNPFNDVYTEKEIRFYNLPVYDKDGVVIKTENLFGRCDDYFNKNFRTGEFGAPIMFIDGHLWMSLTPMEIQSHYLPIKRARGKVGIGGLGMGYSLLCIMAKLEVTNIDVYEIDQRVIDFFKANFSRRKGFYKVTFHNIDVRKISGVLFDFFYMDIYQYMLPDEVVQDKIVFTGDNVVGEYHFWGQEKVFKAAIEFGLEMPDVFGCLGVDLFIDMWLHTDKCRLCDSSLDANFISSVLDTF